jgi:hypothetical protein
MIQISGSSQRPIVDLRRGDYEELDQLAAACPSVKAAYPIGHGRLRVCGAAGADPAPGVRGRGRSLGMLEDLEVAAVIDEAAGPRPAGQPLSTGTYLALAALNRLVAPYSKAGFADWWKTTSADRFTKILASALDHRRFWDAMLRSGRRPFAQEVRPLRSRQQGESLMGLLPVSK